MTHHRHICTSLLILLATIKLSAQEEVLPKAPLLPQYGSPFYYETVNLIADDNLKSRLDINLRISYDFLVSVRNPLSAYDGDFIKKVEASVEIFDNNDVSVARDMTRKTIYTRESQSTTAREEQFVDINFSFNLSPGTYKLILEISDAESTRKAREKRENVVLKNFHANRLTVSDLIFMNVAERNDISVSTYSPMQIGGNIYFGKNADAYVEFTDKGLQPELKYDLYRIRSQKGDEKQFVTSATFLVNHQLKNKSLQAEYFNYLLYYTVKESPQKNKYSCVLYIRSDSLEQGLYELKVKVSDGLDADSTVKVFQIKWVDMPLSLRDIDYAIESLRYITTDQEFDELRSGSLENRRAKFESFWKKKDPTPQTAYNEVMAEYYKRVDYANLNFGTLKIRDGSRTDRGKIYILFGPPTRTERLFSPDHPPQEVWYYTNLNKKFIFVDESRAGNYKLLSEQ